MMVNPRNSYGETLVRLGNKYPNLVVLDADLSKSTKTIMFAKEYPERFFEMGIAEANMILVHLQCLLLVEFTIRFVWTLLIRAQM